MACYLPCLVRIGANVKKYRHLVLEREEVSIGRSPEVTYCLLSVMISRCHAVLKKAGDGKWNITDNKSVNGVFVNGKKLQSQTPCILSDGDIVQLGIALKTGQSAEFIYKFHSALKIKRSRKVSQEEEIPAKKRLKVQVAADELQDGNCRPSTSDDDGICRTQNCAGGSPYKTYKQKLETYQREQTDVMVKFQAQLAEMQKRLAEKEVEQESMRDQLKKKEEEMKEEFTRKQEEMEAERTRIEQEMQAELEGKLKQREAQLTAYLENQRTSLLAEKQCVERSLQQEMEKALEEKDKQLEEQLIKQKEQLENVICEKELKQKMLETQLQLTQAEKEKQKESTLRAREDMLANFTDLMETELQCSICNELFVWGGGECECGTYWKSVPSLDYETKCPESGTNFYLNDTCEEVMATSLNCSHAFCNLCIKQWNTRKEDCPVCRTKVTSQVRSIVLDSYIDKMVEHLSDELKESRKKLVASRKVEQAKWDEDHKSDIPTRTHGNRSRPILVDSDEEEDEDHNDEDEEEDGPEMSDSDEGDEDAYYGGHGRCYSCGRRGHWASGCPF